MSSSNIVQRQQAQSTEVSVWDLLVTSRKNQRQTHWLCEVVVLRGSRRDLGRPKGPKDFL